MARVSRTATMTLKSKLTARQKKLAVRTALAHEVNALVNQLHQLQITVRFMKYKIEYLRAVLKEKPKRHRGRKK